MRNYGVQFINQNGTSPSKIMLSLVIPPPPRFELVMLSGWKNGYFGKILQINIVAFALFNMHRTYVFHAKIFSVKNFRIIVNFAQLILGKYLSESLSRRKRIFEVMNFHEIFDFLDFLKSSCSLIVFYLNLSFSVFILV